MRKVFKYELPMDDYITIPLPRFTQILSVQVQGDTPYLWALVDPDKPMIERRFRLAGTGHPIEEDHSLLSFIGTFQFFKLDWRLVFHLFEILSIEDVMVRNRKLF